jgi:cell division protein FtsX
MPVFIASIGGMLINLVGTLAGRVLVALGISVVTYSGINATLDALKSQAISSFTALPPEVMSMLSMMRVGQCISIVSSAIAARMLLNGLTGDTFKRWVHK